MARDEADVETLKGVRGVILDAVGTVIEPVPSVADAYVATARRQGVEISRAEVKERFQRFFRVDEDDDRLGPLATDEPAEERRWRRIVRNVLPELPDGDLGFAELWDHFGRPTAWRTFPDVAPTLRALAEAGLQVVLASNFDGRLRGVAAGLPDLAAVADEPIISSEVGYRKPHASFYLACLAQLDLPAEDVLCVGDDPENDVAGAERAGLRAVLLDRSRAFPTVVSRVTTLADLVARLRPLDSTDPVCR